MHPLTNDIIKVIDKYSPYINIDSHIIDSGIDKLEESMDKLIQKCSIPNNDYFRVSNLMKKYYQSFALELECEFKDMLKDNIQNLTYGRMNLMTLFLTNYLANTYINCLPEEVKLQNSSFLRKSHSILMSCRHDKNLEEELLKELKNK